MLVEATVSLILQIKIHQNDFIKTKFTMKESTKTKPIFFCKI